MSKFEGKSAIVIGGETAIGRASAMALAAAGARVTMAGILDQKGADTVAAIRQWGGDAVLVRLDACHTEHIKEADIGSVASFNASADGFPCTVSKHAMVGLTKLSARCYGKTGVTGNCVCPGVIETDIVANTKAHVIDGGWLTA